MIMKFNGKPFKAGDFQKALHKATAKLVGDHLRERVSSVRDPEMGGFATVIVDGEGLDDMSLRIEGTPAVLDQVHQDLGVETDVEDRELEQTSANISPEVFLSFGWEDRDLAGRIAYALQRHGISTWWSEWEIKAGDSLRRKIDQGIGGCTHFIVLLTPTSINRPWVQEEMDAGFVQKVGRGATFIGLRHGLEASRLPPLLAGSLSPEIDQDLTQIQQLINDIHGVSRKPELGPAPALTSLPKTRYTAAAMAIAEHFINQSRNGEFGDVTSDEERIAERTSLSREDVIDALHELRRWLKIGYGSVLVRETFYAEFDRYWKPWVPADDALRLAADLVNDTNFPSAPEQIAQRYGWEPRRLNPAMAYLEERDAVQLSRALATTPYIGFKIRRTDATRRFVRSHA
ncbi:TPA: toll/interleukin-1 receptor domain-containing protein [Stenotrophomonas maltophilia]